MLRSSSYSLRITSFFLLLSSPDSSRISSSTIVESGTSSIISSAIDSIRLSLTVLFFDLALSWGFAAAPTAGTRPLLFGRDYFWTLATILSTPELLLLGRSSSIVSLSLGTESSKSSGYSSSMIDSLVASVFGFEDRYLRLSFKRDFLSLVCGTPLCRLANTDIKLNGSLSTWAFCLNSSMNTVDSCDFFGSLFVLELSPIISAIESISSDGNPVFSLIFFFSARYRLRSYSLVRFTSRSNRPYSSSMSRDNFYLCRFAACLPQCPLSHRWMMRAALFLRSCSFLACSSAIFFMFKAPGRVGASLW